jgi:hypothetical protein
MNSLDALPTLHRELYKLLLSTVSDRVQLPAYEHCLETNAQVERAPGAYRVPARISHSMCVVVLSGLRALLGDKCSSRACARGIQGPS